MVAPDRAELWDEAPYWREPASDFGQGYQISILPKIAFAVILLIAMTLSGAWLFSTPTADHTSAKLEYIAIRTTNLRSEPSTGASVEGRLHRGDHVTATLVTTSDPALWVKVIDGPHAGRFAWLKNLSAENSGKGSGASEADKNARYQPVSSPEQNALKLVPKQPVITSATSAPEPGLSLAALKEADWKKIGMGCSCTFATGTPPKEKLIAGGDGLTFFRLNGKERLCAAPDTQAMFDGPVSMSCGSTAVQITPFGKVAPGLDGHSSKARLHIADPTGMLTLSGTWGCGC